MKIVLLIFLFIFALQDIKNRSISVYLLILYLTMWGIGFVADGARIDMSLMSGLLLGLLGFAMAIVSKEKMGLGDAAMISIIGITVGGIDTIWIWWIASVIALMLCMGDKLKKRIKAAMTIEAAVIIPTVLIITVLLIDASIVLYKRVDSLEKVNWDMTYQVKQRRLIDKGKKIIGLEVGYD